MDGRDKGFDGSAFYRALDATVKARKTTWAQVAKATSVSSTTLTRMAQGRRPDAASLAVLSAWAGLNPADFVDTPHKAVRPESVPAAMSYFRADPSLNPAAVEALDAIIQAAYEKLRKPRTE